MAQSSYQLINLTSDIVLSWPFSFQEGPVIADINNVVPTDNGYKITLPDATLASNGQNVIFNNTSLFSFQIFENDGITSVVSILAGEIYYLYLNDNSTPNGVWTPIPFGGGTSAINFVEAESTDNSIIITGGILTPPGGTIDFSLPTSISNLNNVSTTGFPVITSTAPLTWITRELLGGENITISNGDGISDNPIIDLNPALSSLGSVSLNNGLVLSGDLITTGIVNGSVQLNSAGTGKVFINGVSIDANGNVTGIPTPRAFCTFTDTISPPNNTIVLQDQSNITSVTGSSGVYVINFTTPLSSTNYGVFFGLGSTGSLLPFVSNAYWTIKELSSVTIEVVNASGTLVNDVPNGISVMIMLSN
jgi:hypothetical protein